MKKEATKQKNDLERNPWTTVSSKVVYDNPWLSFREDQVINPSGGTGIYGVASLKTIGVSTIPIDDEGNIWLVRQYRYALGNYTWEICSGGAKKSRQSKDASEDLLEAAKRELLEETGISASKWTDLATIDVSNSVTDAIGFIYIAQGLSIHDAQNDDNEDIKVKKMPFGEALAMLERKQITEITSIVGLLKLSILRSNFGL